MTFLELDEFIEKALVSVKKDKDYINRIKKQANNANGAIRPRYTNLSS